jgi:hypothetical protein
VPQNPQTAEAQLNRFNELGISIIKIDSDLPSQLWQTADSLGFRVWGELGIRYPTASTFTEPDSSLIVQIQERALSYLSQPSVTALELFSFGATNESIFWDQLAPIASQLRTNQNKNLYHHGYSPTVADTLVSNFLLYHSRITAANADIFLIPHNKKIGGYLYAPSKEVASYLYPFRRLIDQTASAKSTPVIVESSWLFGMIERHPSFEDVIQSLTSQQSTAFALPDEELPASTPPILPIVLLLAVWGSIAFHYHTSPIYRKSIFRYFSAHKFFITDIFQRHIRSPLPAVLIIIQNALLTAAANFVAFLTGISMLGTEALFYHFPILTIWDNSPHTIFIWLVLVLLAISLVSVLWLYFSHKTINSLTQIATIYAWPLQLNILLSTITITLFASEANSGSIFTFAILTIVVSILSFVIAAGDINRFSRSGIGFLLKTTVAYSLLLIGTTIAVVLNTQWMEVINLARWLT